jgi:hypothetical protein
MPGLILATSHSSGCSHSCSYPFLFHHRLGGDPPKALLNCLTSTRLEAACTGSEFFGLSPPGSPLTMWSQSPLSMQNWGLWQSPSYPL